MPETRVLRSRSLFKIDHDTSRRHGPVDGHSFAAHDCLMDNIFAWTVRGGILSSNTCNLWHMIITFHSCFIEHILKRHTYTFHIQLMHDSTGQYWLQHMVHGTSKALGAAGPSVCHPSGPELRFFLEAARTFEVCRAIIFNQPTFLSDGDWEKLLSGATQDKRRSLDTLLDLVVKCSRLRVW